MSWRRSTWRAGERPASDGGDRPRRHGERYLSKVFNDEWLRENQILDAERVSVGALLEARNSGAPR